METLHLTRDKHHGGPLCGQPRFDRTALVPMEWWNGNREGVCQQCLEESSPRTCPWCGAVTDQCLACERPRPEPQRTHCECGTVLDWPGTHYPLDPCGTDGVCVSCGARYPWDWSRGPLPELIEEEEST